MKRVLLILISITFIFSTKAQTPLTEAVEFHVKTLDGDPVYLFPLLDAGKIVVIDFFSTSCGPCQEYAPDFQQAYEAFGENESNVYFMGINWGDNNENVHEFDSIFGLTFPTASGIQGGGNYVYEDYEILTYPTVIIITPDHQIVNQYLWPPSADSIISAVTDAGGMYVGIEDIKKQTVENISVYPNPVTNSARLMINLKSAASVGFDLIDMVGKVHFTSTNHDLNKGTNRIEIPVSGLDNGMYFVRLSVNGAVVDSYRFTIAR
jgi:thiol-disulfide isomerase/thioredoxin